MPADVASDSAYRSSSASERTVGVVHGLQHAETPAVRESIGTTRIERVR